MNKEGFIHQDWNEVVLQKPIEIKHSTSSNNKSKSLNKLDQNETIVSLPKTNLELKTAIQKGRIAKKMSQKQLASQMNVSVQMISQYENGKAIPNNSFISRIEKVLQVKLPRIKK